MPCSKRGSACTPIRGTTSTGRPGSRRPTPPRHESRPSSDDAALVELVRLAQMPGWGGRDGHTGIFPFIPGSGTHVYPILLWQFSDGLVITAAKAPYEDLVGSRIVAIDGHPIEEVLRDVEPLAPRDNPSNLRSYATLYLRAASCSRDSAYLDAAGPATFTVVAPERPAPRPGGRDRADPRRRRRRVARRRPADPAVGQPLWLKPQGTTRCGGPTSPTRRRCTSSTTRSRGGINAIADEILERAKQPDVDRVVVDLRHNGGGDNSTYRRFLRDAPGPGDRPARATGRS